MRLCLCITYTVQQAIHIHIASGTRSIVTHSPNVRVFLCMQKCLYAYEYVLLKIPFSSSFFFVVVCTKRSKRDFPFCCFSFFPFSRNPKPAQNFVFLFRRLSSIFFSSTLLFFSHLFRWGLEQTIWSKFTLTI